MKDYAREVMALIIMMMFSYILYENPHDDLLIGALIAAFSTAIGFYLGGSKVGADTAKINADTVSMSARSSGEVQPVEVINSDDKPVPVDTK